MNHSVINSSHIKAEECEKQKMATNGLPALTPENLNNQNNYKLISQDTKSKSTKSYPVNTEVSPFIAGMIIIILLLGYFSLYHVEV